jgi:Fe2+ or Zn2+ uptake regulation protein
VQRVNGDTIEDRLRAAGLRVTAPRVAVLRVLGEARDHPRVDQVIERVRAAGNSISTQAAYDVCEAPCLEPHSTRGFVVDEAEVTYWGLCERCR